MGSDPKSDENLFQQALTIYRTEGVNSLFGSVRDFAKYNLYKPVRNKVTGFADRHKLFGPNEIYSTDYYLKRKKDPWRKESNHIGEVLNDQFEPKSVIDFGCAVGTHLEPFYEDGVEIQGVEGNEKAVENAVIPRENIIQHDLREPYMPSMTYDLALSIEVAEHIPERFDDIYVDTLCNSANRIVITAASPGQGGTHHVNEKPKRYWIRKFEERRFEFAEKTTTELAEVFKVEHSAWVKDNLLVFEKT